MAPLLQTASPQPPEASFMVSHQKVEIELDLLSRSLKGKTELTITPLSRDLREIRLNCRQCELKALAINGKPSPSVRYEDCYKRVKLPFSASIRQYHMLQERLEKSLRDRPGEELVVALPKTLRIEELDPYLEEAQASQLSKAFGGNKRASEASAAELAQAPRAGTLQASRFSTFTLYIEYEIKRIRDGMHFVGLARGDSRYPHAYTVNSTSPGTACCLFPCLDDVTSRCLWDISIKASRTVGDMFKRKNNNIRHVKGVANGIVAHEKLGLDDGIDSFTNEDMSMEFSVICSGNMVDEIVDNRDTSTKTTSFNCSTEVSAQHIGFAIGIFEEVNLSTFRGTDEDDRIGNNAIPLHAYCTPGRSEELKNACFPIPQAIDDSVMSFGAFPFPNYNLCFVDDAPTAVLHTATLSLCSSRLLFPEDVIDQLDLVTRQLVHALATQWVGINVVARAAEDVWTIVAIAWFMTETFMRKLCGKNDHRYRMKQAADRVVAMDIDRPSLVALGSALDLDPSQMEFMALKAPLVLFILDQRILKGGSSLGVTRIISKMLLNARMGDIQNSALDTAYFIKICERMSHAKLDDFFYQWVRCAGCPKFRITQRFNKKKLVVEMMIQQVQGETVKERALEPEKFMRDVKEEQNDIFADLVPDCFTGPMTIRIHEADGTPYEHIVQINARLQKLDIPYNTKYKRLKRSRRQKDRTNRAGDTEYAGDDSGDMLLYSLGDVLQSEEEFEKWKLRDWSAEEEEQMGQESYEWIRMDADFEWICRMSMSMPGYMWVSQLQQDRDVVAQYESVQFLDAQSGHALVATFLVRTLMDTRYFHGIRTAAVAALAKNAKASSDYVALFHLKKAFQEFYCYPDSPLTRPNDFSDRAAYLVQCVIPQAIGNVRNPEGRSTFDARQWLLEQLKYNDNSSNEFSDAYYIAILLKALARAMSTKRPIHEIEDLEDPGEDDIHFQNACLEEIDRYRRIDEWVPSHHNIISSAALDCLRALVDSNYIRFSPVDFLQYTSEFTTSILRLNALDHLMSLTLARNPPILRFFLFVLGNDPSPFVRDNLFHVLGRMLGSIAMGIDKDPAPNVDPQGDFTIEQEASTEARKLDHARRYTIPGALDALKHELSSNETLQEGLWNAITSPVISLKQMWQLLEICDKLFIPETKMIVSLKIPRYWTSEYLGKGRMIFRQNGRFRKAPVKKKSQPIKLRLSSGSLAFIPTAPEVIKSEPQRPESSTGLPRTLFKPPKPPTQRQVSMNSVGSADEGRESANGAAKPKLLLKLKPKILGGGSGSPS